MCPIFYFLTVFNEKSIDKLEEFIHYCDNERICLKPKGMSRVKYRAHSQMIYKSNRRSTSQESGLQPALQRLGVSPLRYEYRPF